MSFPQTRLRRLRSNPFMRDLVAESTIDPSKLIWPLFVVPGKNIREPIPSMPGIDHLSIDLLVQEVRAAAAEGIRAVLLFGVPSEKDDRGTTAVKADGLVPQAIEAVKEAVPNVLVVTDICLCGYMTHGHCGVLDNQGHIVNDATLEILSAMALAHAKAGADIVAPSDMMDGRVAAIRTTLDGSGFENTAIMSYAAKFASSFYGPFRDAAHSSPAFGDRKSYQMDVRNSREALREMELDIDEGADIVMVKPAMPALDIIAKARDRFDVPLAAYQVSGEYAMIKAAAAKGWLDEKAAIRESLTAIRRAGADIIISYFARDFIRQQ
ncbi:MAG: porphobilinogen synthase [Deltaproteobacteria bacterium]|nr:porphobilinogen synthase [Deltaproteobacteria bacterium]